VAYCLNKAGVPVRVVAANQRVGGRILSQAKALSTESIGEVNHKSKNPRAIKLDRISIKTYLNCHYPDLLLRRFIKVVYPNEYGLEVNRQSAINLLLLIGKEPDKIEIFGSSNRRYQIRGGN